MPRFFYFFFLEVFLKMRINSELDKKLWDMAEDESLREFFCNVGDNDWPNDIEAYLEDPEEAFGYMSIWEPFEYWDLADVMEEVRDRTWCLHNLLVKAIELASKQKKEKK